jgi:hypothetical protein
VNGQLNLDIDLYALFRKRNSGGNHRPHPRAASLLVRIFARQMTKMNQWRRRRVIGDATKSLAT